MGCSPLRRLSPAVSGAGKFDLDAYDALVEDQVKAGVEVGDAGAGRWAGLRWVVLWCRWVLEPGAGGGPKQGGGGGGCWGNNGQATRWLGVSAGGRWLRWVGWS